MTEIQMGGGASSATESDSQMRVFFQPYVAWAKSLCAPIWWWDRDKNLRNATVTFLRTESEVLGITNAHVVDGISICTDLPGEGCQLGGAVFDPARLIARHPSLDLATFKLSDVFLTQAGHSAGSITAWPPQLPSEGTVVMLGGYPARYREFDGKHFSFRLAWFAAKLASVSERNLGITLDIETSKSISATRIPGNPDLGGWSGGPVFQSIESEGIERLELVGIIYEFNPTFEIAFAHPLCDLLEDGTFAS
jgi:hypothetical protein